MGNYNGIRRWYIPPCLIGEQSADGRLLGKGIFGDAVVASLSNRQGQDWFCLSYFFLVCITYFNPHFCS
jgi:hypothetical protein